MPPRTLSRRFFGEFSRYRLDAFQTRFGTVEWMVFDAEVTDPVTGGPACIRQANSMEEAKAGLEGDE